jgi:hypothetical protein
MQLVVYLVRLVCLVFLVHLRLVTQNFGYFPGDHGIRRPRIESLGSALDGLLPKSPIQKYLKS